MNILILSSIYPNPIEPTKGLFNQYLARALASDHNVTVITPVSWYRELQAIGRRSQAIPSSRLEQKDGIRVYYPRYYYPPKILRSRYGWFYWRSVCGSVHRAMDSHPPDVILSFWVHPDGEASVRAARERAVPAVTVIGGSDVLLLARDPVRRRCIVNVLRSLDSVVAVSSDLRNKILGLGVSSEKVHVWSRGVESSHFTSGSSTAARNLLGIPGSVPIILWVGRLVPVKGLDILLRACALLRARDVDYHLYLIGDGPLRRELTAQTEANGLSESVTFVGPKLHDELPDWYRAADLTVLPSRSEGLPNVLRESLACSTPFVASDVGGISEIGDDSCSILVPPENPEALAEAIQRGLCLWASAGRPVISPRFMTWSESADSLLQILKTRTLTSQVAAP